MLDATGLSATFLVTLLIGVRQIPALHALGRNFNNLKNELRVSSGEKYALCSCFQDTIEACPVT
jgi:hypothetical protein